MSRQLLGLSANVSALTTSLNRTQEHYSLMVLAPGEGVWLLLLLQSNGFCNPRHACSLHLPAVPQC